MAIRPCPHRCFLSDLSDEILASKRLFRLMGTVVAIQADDESDESYAQILIDDGTDQRFVIALQSMIRQIDLVQGNVVECIASFERNGSMNSSDPTLFVKQLARVDDPNAQTLRWLEIVHTQLHPKDASTSLGYPSRSIQPDDLFQIISSEAMVGNKNGVTLIELALVLDVSEAIVAKMMEELQLSGQVYRNETGGYLPL
ncbi:hypothetical protein MPSEU_000840800 [Mayamaea pseudoterrestris]|nr:hypothetical protein MPSEU_000840800 [Mayamaea pseudoterrestris]